MTVATRQWTGPQREAIEHRGGDLVVSASAGSGKTAVLTERVLQFVLGGDGLRDPVPIERMLIITFTEKAAREMRERIERELRARLETEPDHPLLRAALDVLPGAWIMTIDAFCRRLVIEHFHRAGVSPEPRIPEPTEMDRLERDTLARLLEEQSAHPESRKTLAGLLRAQTGGADALLGEVRAIMRFLESLDDPQQWLATTRGRIAATLNAQNYADLPEAFAAGVGFRRSLLEYVEGLRELIRICTARPHESTVMAEWERLANELQALGAPGVGFYPDAIASLLEGRFLPTLAKLMNKGVCGASLFADKDFIKHNLKPAADHFQRWMKHWFPLNEAGLLRGAKLAAQQSAALLDLAETAAGKLAVQKLRRGIVTFNDFERLALKVLSDPNHPGDPSDIAYDLRRQFETVMVDEYQDTSPLQDAIVRRVARWDDPAVPGNLFVVGDIKQSIYRFRHAEPDLFRSLIDRDHPHHPARPPRLVHLDTNFRSRPGILHFVNAAFDRLMDPPIGDIDYRKTERLVPQREDEPGQLRVEAHWLTRNNNDHDALDEDDEPAAEQNCDDPDNELTSLERVDAQAAWTARRIRALTTQGHAPGDCAILLRSLRFEIDVWVHALEAEGLKVRAQGIDPLFTAPELLDLIAALRLADNPLQDIPLAAVLRSPLGNFSDDDLLRIRLARRGGPFHAAFWQVAGRALDVADDHENSEPDLAARAEGFMAMLDGWREAARLRPAAEVLEVVLADTHYEAWLAGHPAAQAALQHIDFLRGLLRRLGRATAGENSLATFLDSIDRALEQAERVGELAETVAADNDAVHLLTMHGAKGLEFPVVFLPRLERRFRICKISDMLLDRESGMALRGVDADRRRQFPTLLHRTLSESLRRRERAEELRLLYVAMTRARERLVLVAGVNDRQSLIEKSQRLSLLGDRAIPAIDRLHAPAPIDLIGPIAEWLAREQRPGWLSIEEIPAIYDDRTLEDRPELVRAFARTGDSPSSDWQDAVEALIDEADLDGPQEIELIRLLPPHDPAARLAALPLKTTVTALRRNESPAEEFARESNAFDETEMLGPAFRREGTLADRKPRWLDDPRGKNINLDAAQRGTLMHAILARIPLTPAPSSTAIRSAALDAIIRSGIFPLENPGNSLSESIFAQLDLPAIEWFFTTEPGKLMQAHPHSVSRELPFTAARPLADFDPRAAADFPDETILLQGIIDAVIDEGSTLTLLDYKTDRLPPGHTTESLVDKHRLQLTLYTSAIKSIWGVRNTRAALVFLHPRQLVWL